jgi:RhtB (resistance to homoserine/threonine) family protein
MNYLSEFLLVAAAHLVAVASPGPDFAIVLRQSITHGRRVAIWTSLGIGTGIFLHVGYSLLGLGFLLESSALWFAVVKYAGAAYLAWIGFNALRARPAKLDAAGNAPKPPPPAGHGAFMTGFLVNALNPKAALFFIALFSTVIDARTPRLIQAGYGVWMALATMAWFSSVSLFFTRETVRNAFLRAGHWFERVMGVLLLALAVRLALATLR